jgi:putative ABC transport system permease protein
MFLRLVADSFTRRPRRKLLTTAALALGMAVTTAALSVSLDVGDRLASEFRSLGANLLVTPQADSLPLQIGGVDYRPANAGAYLPEADLGKLKTIFWRHNIVGFAPILEAPGVFHADPTPAGAPSQNSPVQLIGTWSHHALKIPDGNTYETGIEKTNPWWNVQGQWFHEGQSESVVGSALADRLKMKVGDTIFLQNGDYAGQLGPAHKFTVTGILSTGASEDQAVVMSLEDLRQLVQLNDTVYRRLYVSALTKPENAFARKDPRTMTAEEYDRWYCSPYISSIALQVSEVLKGTDVRVIRRVADGEGQILTRVRLLLWLVTIAALLASALAVGASAAASVLERRTEIGLMKALGAGSGMVGVLLAAEQLLLAIVGGGFGYGFGVMLARLVGERIFGFTPEPKLFVLLLILCLAALITLLGSALPMRRAWRYQPAPILRGE